METDLDRVRTELSEIHERLLAIPADAFDERSRLKDRQNELRKLSHELIEGEPLHNREALKAAYERLREVRDQLLELRLQHSSTSAGDAGIESTFTSAINKAIDAGAGLDDVEARISQILEQMRNSR